MTKKRIGKLNNCENVGLEMQRVYRQLRRNEIEAGYAKSLIYILSQIVIVHRDTDIEKRLQAIEDMK
jgi:hypothetical protein